MENILLSSLMLSFLVLGVLFFRKFGADRYSRRLARALWIIVILRMLIPFNPLGERSLIKLPNNSSLSREIQATVPGFISEIEAQPVLGENTEPSHGEMSSFQSMESELVAPVLAAKSTTITLEQFAVSIWLVGMCTSFALVGWSHFKFHSELKRRIQKVDGRVLERIQQELGRKVKVYSVESNESPMVIQVFDPAIVLPRQLLEQVTEKDFPKQLKFVLEHEYKHIIQKDLLIKMLYLIGRSIHWFNPLVYLIESCLNEDIELATDESVTRKLDERQRAAYCLSILEVAEALPAMANNYSSRFTGDLESMKKRISSLFNKNRIKHGRMILITILLVAFLTIGLVGCEMPLLVEVEPQVVETETSEPITEPTEITEEQTEEVIPTQEDTSDQSIPTNPAPPTVVDNIDPDEQVLIEGGTFWMGCDEENNAGFSCRQSELPRHQVTLDPYLIDRYEVTNGQYQLCVEAGVCQAQRPISAGLYAETGQSDSVANYPVTNINYEDAKNYCSFVGKRLPTEAEWEMAARGSNETVFPWGDENPDCTQANSLNPLNATACVGGIMPVGSYPAGSSSYGVMDMSGNVWEWVADVYSSDYYANSPAENPTGPESGSEYVVRGGGFSGNWSYLRNSARSYDLGFYSGADLGFRCAQDVD
jgi:formylglycine-generating enzyme required for sulfatase activity/beta-lactamase regulating signal transducer with metallopeptidase domain